MKRKSILLLIPFAAMAMAGCDNNKQPDTDPCESSVVELSKTAISLEVGESKTLSATPSVTGCDLGDITWESDHPEIATVANGVVTGVTVGTAVISANGTTCTVTVTTPAPARNYGTESNPLDVAAAKVIIDDECKNNKDVTKQPLYVKGFVKSIVKIYDYSEGPSFEFYLSDGETDLYIYRCLGDATKKENFEVGSEVIVKGKVKNYNGTLEMCDNGDDKSTAISVAASTKTLASIESVDAPSEISKDASMITSSVNVVVVFSDGFKGVVHPDSIDLDTSVAGETTGTVHVGDQTKTFTVTVTAPKENKFAEAYAAAKALTSDATEEFYFEGVVIAKRGDDCFIQDGEYGIDVYKPSVTVNVGDKIGVTSTLQNYNGMPETKTIKTIEALGTAALPEAVNITSKAAHEALNISILCGIEAQVKALPEYVSGKDYSFTVSIGDDDFAIFINKSIYASFSETLAGLAVGDDITIGNAVTGIYTKNSTTTYQISIVSGSNITKVVHSVTGVSLDKETLSLEAGAAPATLVATVAPENATNKAVTWTSSNEDAATVVDGVVTPAAVGEATITVKTVEGNFTAECVVTVTAATRTMTGITVEGPTKVEYTEGDTLDLTGLVVKAVYDSGDPEVIAAGYSTSIAHGATLATTDTSFTVSYNSFTSAPIALTVNEKEPIVAEGSYVIKHVVDTTTYYLKENGTSGAPAAVTDLAEATVFRFALVDETLDTYTIKTLEGKYLYSTKSNDGVRVGGTEFNWIIEKGAEGLSGDFNIKQTSALNDGETGRFLTLYNNSDFRTYNSAKASNRKQNSNLEAVVVKEIDHIAIEEEPTKKSYYVGDAIDLTGLVVRAYYTDDTDEIIDNDKLTVSPKTFQAAAEQRDITVTYQEKNAHFKVEVKVDDRTITSIKFADGCDMTKKEYEVGDDWDPKGLKVIAVRSDDSEFELADSDVTFTYDKTTEAAAESMTLNVTAHYVVDDSTTLDSTAKAISVVVKEKAVPTTDDVEVALKGFAKSTSTTYVSTEISDAVDGVTYNVNNINPSTGQVKGNQTTTTANFYIYNSTALSKKLVGIKLVFSDADASNYFKNNMYLVVGTESVGDTTTLPESKITANLSSDKTTFSFDLSELTFSYFKMMSNEKFTNGTCKDVKVVLQFEKAA